jgi:response regulator of citrate/malate metabolism
MSYQEDRVSIAQSLHLGVVDFMCKPLRSNEARPRPHPL